jgi:DUF1365 family protein
MAGSADSPLRSGLYHGEVAHTRLRPRRHKLRYRLFLMSLDLGEISAAVRRCRLFAHNRFNLFSFYDRDHGDGSNRPVVEQIQDHLKRAGIALDGGSVRLVCLPRIMGYVFNPISVYYCHDASGVLRAMVYEVNNTFGERHSYLIPVVDAADPIRQSCAKRLHVSPFMDMDMTYDFRVTQPRNSVAISIVGRDANGPLLAAAFAGRRQDLSDGALLASFFLYPLLTFSVVAAIHWEALKLLLKRIKVHDHRPAPRHSFTLVPPGTPEAL